MMELWYAFNYWLLDHFWILLAVRLGMIALVLFLLHQAVILVFRILGKIAEVFFNFLAWLYRIRIGIVRWMDSLCDTRYYTSNPMDLIVCAAICYALLFYAPHLKMLQNTPLAVLQQELFFARCPFELLAPVVAIGWLLFYLCTAGPISLVAAIVLKLVRIPLELVYSPLTLLLLWGKSGSDGGGDDYTPMPSGMGSGSGSAPAPAEPSDSPTQFRPIYNNPENGNPTSWQNPNDYDQGGISSNGDVNYYRKEKIDTEEAPVERDEDGFAPFPYP